MPGPPSRQAVLARLALLAATLIWGTSFVIIQRALADLPVFHLGDEGLGRGLEG